MNINVIIESNDIIPADKATGGETDPILWCRNGEYRVIPIEIIENAVNVMSMYVVFDGKRTNPTPMILWSQGIPISNLAGRALIGE